MIRSTKKCLSLLLIFCLGILFLYTTYRARAGHGRRQTNGKRADIIIPRLVQQQVHFGDTKTNTTVRTTEESTSKTFIYLTQTEQCLPSNLSSARVIGDSKTCNCDVIVLSYREECQEEKPSHISYILVKESTWTSGRNILYFAARERMPGYHYYIFLDDDVDLGFNSFTPQELKILTPFRAFEQWLLEYEPAVGTLANSHRAKKLLERRRTLCGMSQETSMVVPTMWFDALFNAFHHKAIKHILPYPTQYDKLSWWTSQLHAMCSVELIFRGQALLCVPLTVFNRQHRPYPRKSQKMYAQVPAIVREIQKRAPVVYQNRTLFKELKSKLVMRRKYTKKTTTYCMNTTRRHPIIPYQHFERETRKT